MCTEWWSKAARLLEDGRERIAVQNKSGWLLLPESVTSTVLIRPEHMHAATPLVTDALASVRFLAPVAPRKIIGVGLNYVSHAHEVGATLPDHPLLFSKFVTSVIGNGDQIVFDEDVTQAVDWEVELAVVVGKRLRRASKDEALEGIFGYTVANDVSARDIQFAEIQWTRAKSLDTFCPIGPWIVTPTAIDHRDARLRTRVNGILMQDGSTNDMCFDVPTLLAFCSRSFTLEPGDVVLTGTPPGVGAFRKPPIYLLNGDVVEVEIEGIGTLANVVRMTSGTARSMP